VALSFGSNQGTVRLAQGLVFRPPRTAFRFASARLKLTRLRIQSRGSWKDQNTADAGRVWVRFNNSLEFGIEDFSKPDP
jgi:hypothetical protein